MVHWRMSPSNSHVPDRRYNLYEGSGHTDNEYGVGIYIARMCEWVRCRSNESINWSIEKIDVTWICVDYWYSFTKRSLATNMFPAANIKFLSIYPPQRSGKTDRLNDYFQLKLAFVNPAQCDFYTDDREILAKRLLHKLHQAWVSSWHEWDKVVGFKHRRWPVKVWIHNHPDQIWEIADDDSLRPLPDHPPVDESIMDLVLKNGSTKP